MVNGIDIDMMLAGWLECVPGGIRLCPILVAVWHLSYIHKELARIDPRRYYEFIWWGIDVVVCKHCYSMWPCPLRMSISVRALISCDVMIIILRTRPD